MVSTPYSSVVNGWKTGSRGCPLAAAPLHQRQQIPKNTTLSGIAMARQFIYHMQGLTKTYPTRKVLENIHLSFYPDAKIGVLGVNGSGKSTLLQDHGRHRQGIYRRGLGRRGRPRRLSRAGAAARRRQDGARERHGRRRQAEGDPRPLQRTDDELLRRDRRRDGQAAGRDRRRRTCGISTAGRAGDGRAALPAGRRRRDQALGRRAPPRRAVPAAARPARPAAARRADQPSRRRIGGVAGRPSAQLSGRDPDRHPRPLLPRQRHRLDPRARSRPRHSLRGQLLGLAGAEAEAAGAGRPRGRRASEDARARAGMDRVLAEGAAGQVQGALPALRGAAEAGQREADPDRADRHSGGRAARPERRRFRGPEQGLRRQPADRRPHLQAAARRHRRRDRRRTAPARPRCSA